MQKASVNGRDFRFGPFSFAPGTGELRKRGIKIKLNGQAVQVLTALLENAGELISREELRSKLWPEGTFVDFDHSLNAVVNRLRQRLGDSAESPCYIETIPGHGYRFIAPVSAKQSPAAAIVPAPEPARQTRYRPLWIAVALALIVGLSVLAGSYGRGAIQRLRRRTPAAAFNSIAVLPLDNMSGDQSQEYLADGLTEQLITDLSKYRSLRVISRTSVMQYKGRRKPLPEIAHELNVQTIVEGSVQRAGDRVRVTAQLIDVASNAHLWSETYDRDLRGILEMEEAIAAMIARQIHVSLVPGEGQPRLSRAPDPAAYQLYLQARYELNDGSERSVRTSLGHFQEAIHRDPGYARAWAGLARAHALLASYPHYDAPGERVPKVRDAAARAIELDPSLAEAHVSLAWVNIFYDWNWDKATQELRRAIDLDPNLAEAYELYSGYYAALGHFDDAWRAASRAVELSPLDLNSSFQLQLILLETKRYSESIALGRKLLEREPRAAGIRAFVGLSAVLSGHADEGIRELEKAAEIGEAPSFRLFLALGLALSGRTDQSRDILRAMEATSKRKYICPYEIASVHAALGEKEDAFQWLRIGLAERCSCMVWLKSEPWLDSIRSDPRYFDLLHSTGIDTAQPPVFTP